MNVLIAFVILQVITRQLGRCQGGGGPSTFGYDASSACSKPYSRTGRMRLVNLPCDFRRQSWCTVAGSSYPWQAVRRFVQENQGLMRRMYGDERHINVLRAEFERNDIELKYDSYHHLDDRRKYQYIEDYEYLYDDQPPSKLNVEEYEGRAFTSRSFSDSASKRQNKFPKLSEYTRPHFRPTERTTMTTATTTTDSTTSSIPSFSTEASTTGTTASSTITSSTRESTTKSLPATTTLPTSTIEERLENTTDDLPAVTVSHITKEQNFSINEIPGQIDRIDEDLEDDVEVSEVPEAILDETTTVTSHGTTAASVEFGMDPDSSKGTFASPTEQQFRPRPEYRPGTKPEVSTMEGQLYQDVAAKEQQEQPVLKLRGVNACPVTEEVVAPYWANNTRGELLALLNLYPFEQYVHWEKCTHENKQMHCREGCRCEQQYRLHRLLAYDPHNECRGIFSDWFKFPSCCICRCYDLPLEFRVTSRSPRTQKQRIIRVQSPRSRYA